MSKDFALKISGLSFALAWSLIIWFCQIMSVDQVLVFGAMGGVAYYGLVRFWHRWPRGPIAQAA